jgi:glycosyltransferase involved in cell wall biosynthesis
MNFLFVHQNFPGQFVHIVRHLAQAGHTVVSIGQGQSADMAGVRRLRYEGANPSETCHEYLKELDLATRNAQAVAEQCQALSGEGFVPDLVVGHGGWGETMFVKDVWPSTPLLNYFEFFYRPTGSDIDFDPEFTPDADIALRLRIRSAINLIGLEAADWGQTPTYWQHRQYPEIHRPRISVIHEGVDTDLLRPEPTARLWLGGGVSFASGDPVITYCARNLEPYRGFHVFMRSLPQVLRRKPNVHVLVVGGDDVSYGRRPADAPNWRERLIAELGDQVDWRRVHFVGKLAYRQYMTVLQVSAVHVYLTYPFVLSWSLLEAMSVGCRIVASRTPPVEEVVSDGDNGHLVDFFDTAALAERIEAALDEVGAADPLREEARRTVIDRYDLQRVCLPAYMGLLNDLIGGRIQGPPWP